MISQNDIDKSKLIKHLNNILILRYDPYESVGNLPIINNFDCIEDGTINKNYMLELLLKSTDLQIPKNTERIVIPFSGGLDSTMVMLLVRKVRPDIKITAVTMYYKSDVDTNVINFCNKVNANTVSLFLDNPLENILDDIKLTKEPKWNRYLYDLYNTCRLNSDVIAFGDGGDETFGGYDFRYKKFLEYQKIIDRYSYARLYLSCHANDWIPDMQNMIGLQNPFSSIIKYLQGFFKTSETLKGVFLADYNGKLMHEWEPTNRKFLETYKLKGVFPFLDTNIIKSCFRLPIIEKYNNGIGRPMLRKICEMLGHDMSKYKVKSSWMSIGDIWKDGAMEICEQYLQKPLVCQEGLINELWIKDTLTYLYDHNDSRYVNKIIQTMAIDIWYRLFVRGESIKSI